MFDATLPDCTTTNNHTSLFHEQQMIPRFLSNSLPGSASDLSAELSVPYEDISSAENGYQTLWRIPSLEEA
ncbi:hypothetical protein NC651_019102 [Populus alba x Populus x berolinensis]|nr:hypothetical protein NC651_019102 [Populus alba x Populus x berolinensis]